MIRNQALILLTSHVLLPGLATSQLSLISELCAFGALVFRNAGWMGLGLETDSELEALSYEVRSRSGQWLLLLRGFFQKYLSWQ